MASDSAQSLWYNKETSEECMVDFFSKILGDIEGCHFRLQNQRYFGFFRRASKEVALADFK